MSASIIVVNPRGLRIPAAVTALPAFRAWAQSEAFPQGVRIDYLAGEVDIDMSPEDVTTHGTPKAAIVAGLHTLVVDRLDAGLVLTDSTRLTCSAADLSAEPDVLVVLYTSLETERIRLVPKVDAVAGRYTEIEGAADLVVECVSDSSVIKDTRVLPGLYHRAGVREYWLVDARESVPQLTIQEWTAASYRAVPADDEGFTPSPLLGRAFRLVRRVLLHGVAVYRLEAHPSI
jgi:Uma2 family endonuclease